MKHTPWLALTLMAGVFTVACAQLEDQYDNDWEARNPNVADADPVEASATEDASNVVVIESSESSKPDAPAKAAPLEYRETVQAIPTGKASNSALLLTKSLPEEVSKNIEFSYALTVKNLTQDDLDNVFVEERLPTSLKALGAEPAMMSNEGGKLVWNIGTLAAGAEQRIQIRAQATADGLAESFAMASYDRALQGQVKVVSPKVNLALSGPDTVSPGDEFDLNFALSNSGTGAARNVEVLAKLPDGLVTPDGKREATLRVPSLGAGETRTLAIRAKATKAGQFAAAAEASLPGGETVSAKSAAITAQETRLELASKAPSKFFLGTPGKVEYTVKNVGQTTATDVHLTQPIPAGVEIVRSSVEAVQADGQATWALGDLTQGETKIITVHMMPSAAGQLNLSASAKASKGAAATTETSVSMEGLAALHFSLEDLQDPVPVGESLTYHVKVHNQGTAPAEAISVTVTLDDGMELVRAAGPTNGKADGRKITFQALDSLDPDATATWRLVIKSRKVGDLRLSAALTSKRLTRPVEDNESTQFYE